MALNPPFTQSTTTPGDPVIYSKITGDPIPRPSNVWMRRPGWIDGAVNPPQYYYSTEQIDEAANLWGPIAGIQCEDRIHEPPSAPNSPLQRDYELDVAMARISPTPVPTIAIRSSSQTNDNMMAHISSTLAPTILACSASQHDDATARISPTPATAVTSLASQGNDAMNEARDPPAMLTGNRTNFAPDSEGMYMVRSTFIYPPACIPGMKPGKKLQATAKVLNINMKTATRVAFMTACLVAHGLSHTFSPGTVSGPLFKIYWTGSAGGKANAASILTDEDFEVNKAVLFRKRMKPEVSMEFASTDLEAFRIREIVAQALSALAGIGDENQELTYGTQVPQVSAFSTSSQLHGMYILELKQKWKCEKHLGEHGEKGHCYQAADGQHIRLNSHRLKIWAPAWAAGDATKHEPPNVTAFDGDRNGGGAIAGPSVKPCGRAGPRLSLAESTNNDLIAVLVGVLLSRKHDRSESSSPNNHRLHTPARPSASLLSPPLSPLPPTGSEIDACLAGFLQSHGIDFVSYASMLHELDLTPDVIPSADNDLLKDIFMTSIGKVLKFKLYCESWNVRHAKKRDVFSV